MFFGNLGFYAVSLRILGYFWGIFRVFGGLGFGFGDLGLGCLGFFLSAVCFWFSGFVGLSICVLCVSGFVVCVFGLLYL